MQGGSSQLVFLVAAVAMFWFLVIRPQQKRAKEQAEMLSALEPGVEIVTVGGIFGTLVEVGEERMRIRVADGSELEIARRAVGSVVTESLAGNTAPDVAETSLDDAQTDPSAADRPDQNA